MGARSHTYTNQPTISNNHTCTQTAQLLRKVGKKLAKAAGCEDLPWEFHVIDAEEIMNAAVCKPIWCFWCCGGWGECVR